MTYYTAKKKDGGDIDIHRTSHRQPPPPTVLVLDKIPGQSVMLILVSIYLPRLSTIHPKRIRVHTICATRRCSRFKYSAARVLLGVVRDTYRQVWLASRPTDLPDLLHLSITKRYPKIHICIGDRMSFATMQPLYPLPLYNS